MCLRGCLRTVCVYVVWRWQWKEQRSATKQGNSARRPRDPKVSTPDIHVENKSNYGYINIRQCHEIIGPPSEYIDNNRCKQFGNSKTLMACLRQVLRSMLLVGTTYTVVLHGFCFLCTRIMLAASQVMNVYCIRLREYILWRLVARLVVVTLNKSNSWPWVLSPQVWSNVCLPRHMMCKDVCVLWLTIILLDMTHTVIDYSFDRLHRKNHILLATIACSCDSRSGTFVFYKTLFPQSIVT